MPRLLFTLEFMLKITKKLIFCLFLLSVTGCVQQTFDSLTDEQVAAILDGQEKIHKELLELKKIIKNPAQDNYKRQKGFETSIISIKGSAFLGHVNAPLTLVEFTDYRCPYCRRHANSTLPLLKKNFIDTGKLKYIVKEFPIESLHPQAYKLSLAALCAGEQNQYWELHDQFFKSAKPDLENIGVFIKELRLDKSKFDKCLTSQKYKKQVDKDIEDGKKTGVRGTPAFVLGEAEPGNPDLIRSIKMIKGAQPYHRFKQAIETQLKRIKQSK